jgi:hypothetical protein
MGSIPEPANEREQRVQEIFVEHGTDQFEIRYDGTAKFLGEKKLKPAKK